MKTRPMYQAAHEIGASIAFIWREKVKRGIDPDAAEAVFHEVVAALRRYERKVRQRMFRTMFRTHNN